MLKIILVFLLAYLLGSIPSGVWIGKLFYKKDLRDYGSHSSGATNAFRVLGPKAGVVVVLMDILKGTAAALLPGLFGLEISMVAVGLFAIIGHVYPIFAGFKGGKAVATSAGVALAYSPIFLGAALILFVTLLYLTSTVSLSSVLSFLVASVSVIFWTDDWYFRIFVWAVTALVVFRHTANIKRIMNGTESKIPFGLRKNKKN